jgi:hypothetical protein
MRADGETSPRATNPVVSTSCDWMDNLSLGKECRAGLCAGFYAF